MLTAYSAESDTWKENCSDSANKNRPKEFRKEKKNGKRINHVQGRTLAPRQVPVFDLSGSFLPAENSFNRLLDDGRPFH